MFLKVYDYCEAVIHLESSHTRVPQQTNEDKETIAIIQRLGENIVFEALNPQNTSIAFMPDYK